MNKTKQNQITMMYEKVMHLVEETLRERHPYLDDEDLLQEIYLYAFENKDKLLVHNVTHADVSKQIIQPVVNNYLHYKDEHERIFGVDLSELKVEYDVESYMIKQEFARILEECIVTPYDMSIVNTLLNRTCPFTETELENTTPAKVNAYKLITSFIKMYRTEERRCSRDKLNTCYDYLDLLADLLG